MLDAILSQLVNGLVLGFIYVLVSLGMSIIWGMMNIANFADGALFSLGAYFTLTLFHLFGWPAVIFAPFLVGLVGVLLELSMFRYLYKAEHLATLMLTFALAQFIQGAINVIWGSAGQPMRPPAFLIGSYEWGPLLVTKYRLAIIAVTITVLCGLYFFLNHTPFGRILRAGVRDPEMVSLLGINTPRVFTLVFGLGTMFAGLAGLLAGPLWNVYPAMQESAIMPAVVTVVVGGMGSYAGVISSGLLIGVTTAMTIQFWPEASSASMFVIMALILLVRPRGLFGVR